MAVEIDLIKDSTGQAIVSELQKQNVFLEEIAASKMSELTADLKGIHQLVKDGLASQVFSVGDQLNIEWTDTATNTKYTVPHDIIGFRDVTLADGEVVPGMVIQWHYTTPFGVQFDQNEAFYYCSAALAAGTYNFKFGNSWGSSVVSGKSYQFTTTKALPVGGQLVLGNATADNGNLPDKAASEWRVRTYEKSADTTPVEILTLTEGTGGTNLGTLSTSTKYADSGVNNLHRAGYGYNRWSQSALRQYLNSTAVKGSWWTAQNVFDRPPAELSTKNGFLSGYSDEFLSIIQPVKVRTALNTVSDSAVGEYEDTYDRFFPLSKEEMFLTPQVSGIEGDAFEYWKRAVGSTTPPVDFTNGVVPITYAINAKTSPQAVRLRSAHRGYGSYTWSVTAAGGVYGYSAPGSIRFAPACVIC